jgi:hypothetical protein
MAKQPWFTVDPEGLAELQRGKPLAYIAREPIANALDQNIKRCTVTLRHEARSIILAVEDDDPKGFQDLAHAFTLFSHTPKREEPTQRGRFALGEKQAISRCTEASIVTTTGSVFFDKKDGRRMGRTKREVGTLVSLRFPGTKADAAEIVETLRSYLPPPGVEYVVNDQIIAHRKPLRSITARLQTEIYDGQQFRKNMRSTEVHVHAANGQAMLYELGIPVCPIACKYTLDVQQKVPLGVDREMVPEPFLRSLYAEVLNATASDLAPEESSEDWVRQGSEDKRVAPEALRTVLQRRYGDKVLVANPNDARSNDEAKSKGYHVLRGSELSGEEWGRAREHGLLQSTTQVFGWTPGNATPVEPTPDMLRVANLARAIAQRVLGIRITVTFYRLPGAGYSARYGQRTMEFVLNRLGEAWFKDPLADKVLGLIIHELGHESGHHTEDAFHQAICAMAAALVRIAREEPDWFTAAQQPLT